MALKDVLAKQLTKKQLQLVPSSFDIVGSREKAVAIVEIPEQLRKKQALIAKALMQQHRNVKTVLMKASPRSGLYRTRVFKKIAGLSSTEVIHKENNCSFALDVQKVYFSPRESAERLRLAVLVKKGECIAVFFAGVGPFAIVLAKKAQPKKVIGIELNPVACRYFAKNIALNKTGNVSVVHGDVTKKVSALGQRCDRVVMPLPEKSIDFLYEALFCMKKNGTCNLYCFAAETELGKKIAEIEEKAHALNHEIKVIGASKVLPYGPGIWKYRIDFTKIK